MSQDVKRAIFVSTSNGYGRNYEMVLNLVQKLLPNGEIKLTTPDLQDLERVVAELKAENERLKRALVDIANKNTCWRLYEIDKYKSYEDGWEGVAEFAAKVLKELEAIEQGEGK